MSDIEIDTVRGHTINIDGRALSHDLLPTGIVGDGAFLPRATVNQLTLIPASGYSFQPCRGIVADLSYAVRADGSVDFPESCELFMAGKGTRTLVIRGYPMVLNATHADSDLLGLTNLGLRPHTPRDLAATLVPAKGYIPQTANGVFRTAFNVKRDGRITFDRAAAGSYVVRTASSPNPSSLGQEVTVTVSVLPVPDGNGTPQGSVTFSEKAVFLGSAPLDKEGTATFRTSLLSLGVHHIAVHYPGDQSFQPSSATVRHRVV